MGLSAELRGRVLDADRRCAGLDPAGATLQAQDREVYSFAAKVASDAAAIEQADVDRLRAVGLADADIADVVFAAAARSFFTRVLDALGAQLDAQTAEAFPADVMASLTVGRPAAETATR